MGKKKKARFDGRVCTAKYEVSETQGGDPTIDDGIGEAQGGKPNCERRTTTTSVRSDARHRDAVTKRGTDVIKKFVT